MSPQVNVIVAASVAAVLTACAVNRQPLESETEDVQALANVHVVNVVDGRIDSNRTILVKGGVITDVISNSVPPPRGARIRNLEGAFVIPGLWDMHAHVGSVGTSVFGLYVAVGVTGVRDMGGDYGTVRAWADSISSGAMLGPRLIVASPVIERAGWLTAVKKFAADNGDTALATDLSRRIPIATPEDATRAVDSIIALKADFLKIRNDAAPQATFALLRHARQKGLRVAGHWPSRIAPSDASDSGYASLEHGPLSIVNRILVPSLDAISVGERQMVFEKFARNGTAYTPTLVSLKGYRLTPDSVIARVLADTAGAFDARMRYVSRAVIAGWRSEFELKKAESPPDDWVSFNRSWLRDIRPMADAGVLLLAGSDVGSPLVFPAFSVADELEALVTDAGLTPLQSLRTATSNVGIWLGSRSIGVVDVGRHADLVFLEGNPLVDIRHVRRIRSVMRGGRFMDRAALDGLLRRAAGAAR